MSKKYDVSKDDLFKMIRANCKDCYPHPDDCLGKRCAFYVLRCRMRRISPAQTNSPLDDFTPTDEDDTDEKETGI